ncbi:MAG TPA: adenylate/guanylate cyclase domain-containing protein, partial [Acidimicrobiales bacterium]|nr:adenylate/guanylate cyclase domain-containing protein [Acidimicrobiales bacterium]
MKTVIMAAVAQPPSGTVTFLFTDIEGSTRLWEERPEEMRELVAQHDSRFRAAIEANDGYVVKGTGDGFHAAFARAADAVKAAEQLQAATADLPGLKVRVGINTGEVQERDGDYFGQAVNRAARLMAAGHGGQVLVAGATAELVPGLTLRNLGEHRLRDLASPMLVWQLGTGDFPPLHTLDVLPGNLPVQRTSFIGRVDEVKQVAALIETERLVTLTGAGGVGKSRLALQVAAEVAPEFKDGVWFASLGSLAESLLVPATVLEAVGVSERQGEAAVDTLCAWASERDALVVIDNCEHLLAEVARVVDRIADSSTTVRIVVTSQEPLGLRGEHVWFVAPLSGYRGVATDSVELFVDRARMARADFALNADNEAAVVEICARLDHVPLAIELAAARMRGMAPADIARRLDQRLRFLSSSDRMVAGRHRTLDAAIRWSYELLDETQRRVFDRLSVFAGPFTIEAAEAIAPGDGVEEWEVLDEVLALVDKSLVIADETSTGARYRLLETMRQFGQANLVDVGVQQLYRERHADFYADYVLSRRPQLHGLGDIEARAEIEREIENIRVALRQAADDRGSSRFDRLYSAMFTIWHLSGRTVEGAAWAAEFPNRPDLDPRERIIALGCAASIATEADVAVAESLATAAEDLASSSYAAPPLLAMAVMALVAMMRGETEAALARVERTLKLAADEPDLFERCHALSTCCSVLAVCGAVDQLDDLL